MKDTINEFVFSTKYVLLRNTKCPKRTSFVIDEEKKIKLISFGKSFIFRFCLGQIKAHLPDIETGEWHKRPCAFECEAMENGERNYYPNPKTYQNTIMHNKRAAKNIYILYCNTISVEKKVDRSEKEEQPKMEEWLLRCAKRKRKKNSFCVNEI